MVGIFCKSAFCWFEISFSLNSIVMQRYWINFSWIWNPPLVANFLARLFIRLSLKHVCTWFNSYFHRFITPGISLRKVASLTRETRLTLFLPSVNANVTHTGCKCWATKLPRCWQSSVTSIELSIPTKIPTYLSFLNDLRLILNVIGNSLTLTVVVSLIINGVPTVFFLFLRLAQNN